MMMLVIVMVATMLDRLVGKDGVCRVVVIGFFVANEGMSIIENANAMGVPYPQGLLDALTRLREKSKQTGDTQDDDQDDSKKEGVSYEKDNCRVALFGGGATVWVGAG